jgi:hypothetical protein
MPLDRVGRCRFAGPLVASIELCMAPFRVVSLAQLPPVSFSLSGDIADRRVDGVGGWPHLLSSCSSLGRSRFPIVEL